MRRTFCNVNTRRKYWIPNRRLNRYICVRGTRNVPPLHVKMLLIGAKSVFPFAAPPESCIDNKMWTILRVFHRAEGTHAASSFGLCPGQSLFPRRGTTWQPETVDFRYKAAVLQADWLQKSARRAIFAYQKPDFDAAVFLLMPNCRCTTNVTTNNQHSEVASFFLFKSFSTCVLTVFQKKV